MKIKEIRWVFFLIAIVLVAPFVWVYVAQLLTGGVIKPADVFGGTPFSVITGVTYVLGFLMIYRYVDEKIYR